MSQYAKGWVALVGSAATWVSTYYPHGEHWVQLVLAVLTAAGVYQVKNTPPAQG